MKNRRDWAIQSEYSPKCETTRCYFNL